MENLLRVVDLATVLRKSENAIYQLRKRGALPDVVKVGHTIYFREKDVIEMLKPENEKKENKNEKSEK